MSEGTDYPIQADAANPSGDKFCRADNYPFEDQEAANTCKVMVQTEFIQTTSQSYLLGFHD